MPSIREWQTLLFAKHKELASWDRVGDFFGITGAMANRIANEAYEPKDTQIRDTLGLESKSEVKHMPGVVNIAGAAVGVNARTCIKRTCNNRFIPNAPIRRKCYYCSPVRSTIATKK